MIFSTQCNITIFIYLAFMSIFFIMFALHCTFSGKVGDSCKLLTDCTHAINASYCKNSLCACYHGLIPDNDHSSCVPMKIGDEGCSSNSECLMSVNHSQCTDSHCLCQLGYHPANAMTSCLLRHIGDGCHTHNDCMHAVPNSKCNSGQCVCNNDFISLRSGTDCVQVALTEEHYFAVTIAVFLIAFLVFVNIFILLLFYKYFTPDTLFPELHQKL